MKNLCYIYLAAPDESLTWQIYSTMDFRGGYKYRCEIGWVYVLYSMSL